MRKQHFDRETWREELPPWCERALGARPARALFEAGWQSAAAWAASLWIMAYDAKGESLDGVVRPVSELLIAERAERLRRAGA